MKITKKDLHDWIMQSLPVRYKGIIYNCFYNGFKYFLSPVNGGESIYLYKKSPRIYGLETNIK